MSKMFLSLMVVFLFFAILVGAFNIVLDNNHRPYRFGEFLNDLRAIKFDVTLVRDFIDDSLKTDSSSDDDDFGASTNGGGGRFETVIKESSHVK